MSVFGNPISGRKSTGIFPTLDLSGSEPVSDSDSDLLIKEDDSVNKTLLHNFVVDDRTDGRHVRRRITCTNPGCKKKQVPAFVRKFSKVCKKGTAPASRTPAQSVEVITQPYQQTVLA